MSTLPTISIVTPSFNQARYLEETIISVISQNYPNLEYIIIDGGSSDGSVDIIKKYEKYLKYWISEKDRGHGNALNKGFLHATGDIMAWINSDDKYYPWTFKVVSSIFSQFQNVNWIVGNNSWFDSEGVLYYTEAVKKNAYDYLSGDYAWIQQESVFWRRNLWQKSGGYIDEQYKFMVDGELWCRFFLYDDLWHVDRVISGYRVHDSNRASANMEVISKEMKTAIDEMRQNINKDAATTKYKCITFYERKWVLTEKDYVPRNELVNIPKKEPVDTVKMITTEEPVDRVKTISQKTVGPVKMVSNVIKYIVQKSLGKYGYAIVKNTTLKEQEHALYEALSKLKMHTMEGALLRCKERGLNINTVIDVGASNGQWSEICLKYFPNAYYLLIEAQKPHEKALEQFQSKFRNSEYLMAAAGKQYGEIYFDASDLFGGLASETPFDKNCIKVPVVTVDGEVAKRKLHPPYGIKLDLHGFEIPVLDGSASILENTELLIIEAYLFQLTRDSLRFYELCSYLDKKGFYPVDIVDLMLREYDNAMWQMDILFIRKDNKTFSYNYYR